MTLKVKIFLVLISGVAVLGATVGLLFLIYSGERPLCHRLVDGAFQMWMQQTGHTNIYPNADGSGSNSLAMIEPFSGKDIQQYGYIPGLTYNDPTNLVLMYLKTKTHYSWHGDTAHTIFSPNRWKVLGPDIFSGPCSEGGDLLDTAEFKKRIQNTIAFLEEHQRPCWQTVAKEQTEFLKSIKE